MDYNNNQNINNAEDDNSESGLDLREIIEQYLGHWKWFLLATVISLFIAFFKLNFESKSYEATAVIKIKDNKRNDKSTLSAFEDFRWYFNKF